jgi:Lectin C-type domain
MTLRAPRFMAKEALGLIDGFPTTLDSHKFFGQDGVVKRHPPMKVVSFAATASTALAAVMTVLASSPVPVALAADQAAGLPRRQQKACNTMNMMAKNCAPTKKPTTKKPAAAVKIPAKPTKKPSQRPTKFPTPLPTNQPTTSLPSAGPSASDIPTKIPTPSACPASVQHNGHLYAHVVHVHGKTWDQAREAAQDQTCCGGAQGHLVIINDADERDFVQAMVSPAVAAYGWIGLADVETEGTYVWVDETPFDASLFTPAPYGGVAGPEVEDCVIFHDDPFVPSKWFARQCSEILYYSIIEFDCP